MKPIVAKSKSSSKPVAQAIAEMRAHAKHKNPLAIRLKVSRWVRPRFPVCVKPAPRQAR
jgi:hypothetical protein